jgi:hypothetical protein
LLGAYKLYNYANSANLLSISLHTKQHAGLSKILELIIQV